MSNNETQNIVFLLRAGGGMTCFRVNSTINIVYETVPVDVQGTRYIAVLYMIGHT